MNQSELLNNLVITNILLNKFLSQEIDERIEISQQPWHHLPALLDYILDFASILSNHLYYIKGTISSFVFVHLQNRFKLLLAVTENCRSHNMDLLLL
jgi:hypothetical protein